MPNMRHVVVPEDTRGVGTPNRAITNDWGEVIAFWDDIDILRLRLARWLFLNGRFNEFGCEDIPRSRLQAALDTL